MEKIKIGYLNEKFNALKANANGNMLHAIKQQGFEQFSIAGIPTIKNEEWKYTPVANLFKKEYTLAQAAQVTSSEIDEVRLPGFEHANELVFVNGVFNAELSKILSDQGQLTVLSLEEAAAQYPEILRDHLDKSSVFINDGVHALNTAFMNGGIFIKVNKNQVVEAPVYIYHILSTEDNAVMANPRSLIYVEQSAKVQFAENYKTFGPMESFTNEVIELAVEDNAIVEYYKIQNDSAQGNHVGTTHIRQIGKCFVHTVTVSLDGGMVRNNIDIIMEKEGNEAHMYGLYLLKNRTHVDNHTLVDNVMPNCYSNELYKGIVDDYATGIFSGKIYVRPDAQKTNAYQSNKNILLSETATVNTKPQLEIFADDVKCSHGCTVGQLDKDALYYLRTRGISEDDARAMLLHAFAEDVVSQIKIEPLFNFVNELIISRLHVREEILLA